jgi:hypothetical protein
LRDDAGSSIFCVCVCHWFNEAITIVKAGLEKKGLLPFILLGLITKNFLRIEWGEKVRQSRHQPEKKSCRAPLLIILIEFN